ncbi:MAG: glycosyltransferase involved in cell wall biosynthesis [Bacteroidia bacterium]|jgi:glycosyltransferase involved in cell wall biosynthesis
MNNKKKLAIIGTVGLPAKYGGFETLADNLVTHLSKDHDITVYCSKKKYTKEERVEKYKGAKLKYLNLDANGIQSIPYDTISILHALFTSEVLLILGVSGAWILPFVRLFTNKKIIISIDGIEWKREKWNLPAKMYLRWAEKMAVQYSHIDISDNESIQDYTAMRYGTVSRVIEYGADHTMKVIPTSDDQKKYPFLIEDYAFKVCRIEPENNVHVILETFKKVPNKKLVVMGNWQANEYGKKLKGKYSNVPNILLFDPTYDQRSIDLLRSNAAIYIHGHSAGGTNPSLVEAMYLGLPIMAYGISYNKTTTEGKAIYFKTEEDLIYLVKNIKKDALNSLGQTMKSIAKRRYIWSLVTDKYRSLVIESLTLKSKQRIESKASTVKPNILASIEIRHLKTTKLIFEK